MSDIASSSSAKPRDDLMMYLSTSYVVVSAILIRKENKPQMPI